MKKGIILAAILVIGGCNSTTTTQTQEQSTVSTAEDGWDFQQSPDALTEHCEDTLTRAASQFEAIESDTAEATLAIVYGAYDEMQLGLQDIQYVWYVSAVHPDTDVQAAAEDCIRQYTDFATTVALSKDFYRRVAAIDLSATTDAERLMLERRLREFRKAGVDKDEATRERVRTLIAEITALGTEFDKNIRTDRRFVDATREELEGLPQDYFAGREPLPSGEFRISTDYPDLYPVLNYAESDELRKQLYIQSRSIATPANDRTLQQLIEKRHELAQLLGYSSHAALAMDGLMIGNPARAAEFLAEISEGVAAPAQRDTELLLARLRQTDPEAERVGVWQRFYLNNLVQQEKYALNAREVREYFHFDRVQRGIFEMTENLFNVEIVPWETDTWSPDVTAWELRENNQPVGRFYLDMHPRENKYKHAAHWTLRTGVKGGKIPMSGMVMNFPRGYMEHRQVETFLHEFGHLLHNMFSGSQPWLDISGMSMERDFVEAPSQMLEEWVWDYDTLKTFAINDAGEPIPESLVEKMVAARHFGEAVATAQQIFYANLALAYYSRDPDELDLLAVLKELQAEYSPYPFVQGTHFYNSFGHLNGYSSNYYMYQWSKAISTDLFSRFAEEGMTNTAVTMDYRRKVLEPGGSKPAAELVEDFLGRPFSADSYSVYLDSLSPVLEQ